MEIIVGTFFIIYLIVVLCKEGIKGLGKAAPVFLVEGFEIISVVVLFLALSNMAESNKWYVLEILTILLMIPLTFGVLILFCLPWFTDVAIPPYEQHRSTRLIQRGREIDGNIDKYWAETSSEKPNQKYGWLKK